MSKYLNLVFGGKFEINKIRKFEKKVIGSYIIGWPNANDKNIPMAGTWQDEHDGIIRENQSAVHIVYIAYSIIMCRCL